MRKIRGTYAIVDLERYLNNVLIAKRLSSSQITPVIKANGYGHGASALAKYLLKYSDINTFCVATIEEGIKLREAIEDKGNIIVLGFIDESYFKEVLNYNLLINIYDDNIAYKFNKLLKDINKKCNVFLKIDTGMNRLGYSTDFDIVNFIDRYSNLNPVLIMSHLSSPDSDEEYTRLQINLFEKVVSRTKTIIPNIKSSLFNSPALTYLKNSFDYARPGIITYGYIKSKEDIGLKPVMSIFSKIIHIKKLEKDQFIGYNKTFRTDKRTKVGILPIGYADGYNRLLSNRGEVFIAGKRYPIIGRICMDMTMVDITDLPEALYDSEVEIMGDNIRADEIASLCSTISYEILTNISSRITRIYIGKNG
ncbi:MAG: alanine racemase [Deferribacterales bacterium]